MSTTQKKREEATKVSTIEHFRQKHRLNLCEEASETENCIVCGKHGDDIILGSLYRCSEGCNFAIHKSCSAIPPVLFCKPQQQPPVLICKKKQQQQEHHNHFHPQHPLFLAYKFSGNKPCNACGNCYYTSPMAYKCLELECSFIIHVTCSFLTPTSSKTIEAQAQAQDQDHHHPHPLILCDPPPRIYTYNCRCCPLLFDSQTPVYVCLEKCKALLHKSCAELPSKLHHPFHPLHPLTLLLPRYRLKYRYKYWSCWACDRRSNGFLYYCSDCNFYLDVTCATSLQPTATTTTTENNEEEDHDQDHRQFTHSHPLMLCHNKQQFPIPCRACDLPLGDSICLCPTCHILMHKSCAQMKREIKHPLHPPHPLTLVHYLFDGDRYRACEGCFFNISDGFSFVCSHCKFSLGVGCGCAFKEPTTMMSKIHHHPLAFFNKPNLRLLCNACHTPCDTPCFRCAWCELNLHVHCIPTLPPNTVKSRFHRHSLTLAKFPIKDRPDEDDDAEFYCDDCEKRRELGRPSYYCRECHYVAHPHCVASDIMRILEKEWSEEESHKRAFEVEEPPSQILEEFLDSFKGDETKEAQGVFVDYNRDSQGGSTKDCLNLGKVTTQIMKMLVSKNEVIKMPWENWNSTSKLIKVNNYMILENLAPILEALLGKHGDFIGRSGLSRKVKMLYIMTVCDAVHSMCNTKVVDVTAKLLVSWIHSFMLGQYSGFEIEFAFDRLRGVARAHFGLQANIIPVDPNFAGHVVKIAKHYALVAGPTLNPKKQLTVIEQDGGTNELNEKAVFIKLAIIKLAGEIRELEKTAEEKRALHRMWKDCFDDAVELMGEIAGNGLW